MSKMKRGYSDDPLYADLDNNYADNVNFFSGKQIVVESKSDAEFNKKEEEDTHEENVENEEKEDVTGVEAIVLGFSTMAVVPAYVEVEGSEGLGSTAKNLLLSLWQLIKDIGIWIKNLFTNKLARVDSRIRFTEQRRKINGIKDGEIKYPSTIRRLMIPSKITMDGDWVYNCADIGITFYEGVLKAHADLKSRINQSFTGDLESAKLKTIDDGIAFPITRAVPGSKPMQTDILPGNRIFVIRHPLTENPEATLTYFMESNIEPQLKNKMFHPTPSLIDNCMKTLNRYRTVVGNAQRNTSEIQREFEREVNKLLKGATVEADHRRYLSWLANTNKRLINTTLQHAIHTIEALDDFINAGLR